MKLSNVALVSGLLLSTALMAKEVAPQDEGKTLHEGNCVSCHQAPGIYTTNSKMKDLNALQNQVERCTTNLKLSWFDNEINAVTAYLNKTYYKFEPKASK